MRANIGFARKISGVIFAVIIRDIRSLSGSFMQQIKLAKLIRWAARIIDVGFAGFFLFFLVIQGTGYLNYLAVGDMLLVVFLFISVAGGLLAWWLERPGAYIMIAFAVLFGALNAYTNGNYFGFIVMFPMELAGVLHLTSRYISKHPTANV